MADYEVIPFNGTEGLMKRVRFFHPPTIAELIAAAQIEFPIEKLSRLEVSNEYGDGCNLRYYDLHIKLY